MSREQYPNIENNGILDRLKEYGLENLKSFSTQIGQIGDGIKAIFSKALGIVNGTVDRSASDRYFFDQSVNSKKSVDDKRSDGVNDARSIRTRFSNMSKGGNDLGKGSLVKKYNRVLPRRNRKLIEKIISQGDQGAKEAREVKGYFDNSETFNPVQFDKTQKTSLVQSLFSAVNIEGREKINRADLYKIGRMSAGKVLERLSRLSQDADKEHFGGETKEWISSGINRFKPASDETFAEYVERRFMGFGLPGAYNDIVKIIKIFNNRDTDKKNEKNIDRQSIGMMSAKRVFRILKINKKIKERDNIRFVLDLSNKVKPVGGESLRRYFYRLTAYQKGCLLQSGVIDDDRLKAGKDFEHLVKILSDVMKEAKWLSGPYPYEDYYQYYDPNNPMKTVN